MNFIEIIALVSSIAGIVTLFIPSHWQSRKIFILVSLILMSGIATVIVSQNSRLEEINRVSRAANQLLKDKTMEFTHEGFTQAGLSFLEQNKGLYPDSYKRAILISENRELDQVTKSFTIAGIIKGIAILNAEK